jgi:hypothetical protein
LKQKTTKKTTSKMVNLFQDKTNLSPIDKLKVDKPCPVLLTRMTKNGQNYFCKSCSKIIVDFREKTIEEIKCSSNKDTCGIFTSEQLQGQQKMTLFRQTFYYFLTILSFFGFSVRPLNAQTTKIIKDTALVEMNAQPKDTVKTDKTAINEKEHMTKSKGLFRKKKKRHKTIGTPSF